MAERDHAPRRARHEVLGVAREVHPAALPARAQQLLADRLDEPGMVVADDQAHAVQATLDERADEARPGGALVVARRQLEAQHPPLAGHGATPVATSAAMDTTRPCSRTLR